MPLIALYTGARLEEICQLHLDDIHEVDGIWVLDINNKGEKNVKSQTSARLVPVHSKLIELGMIKYCKILLNQGQERLFPELNKGKKGYSAQAGRWFNDRYKGKMGVVSTLKSFHSFRHTMIDQLKQKGTIEYNIKALAGHKNDSITTGLYGKPPEPKALLPVIEQLTFPVQPKPFL